MMTQQVGIIQKKGDKQIVLLPSSVRFEVEKVYINVQGESVILTPKKSTWKEFFCDVPLPSDDFMNERGDITPQIRAELF